VKHKILDAIAICNLLGPNSLSSNQRLQVPGMRSTTKLAAAACHATQSAFAGSPTFESLAKRAPFSYVAGLRGACRSRHAGRDNSYAERPRNLEFPLTWPRRFLRMIFPVEYRQARSPRPPPPDGQAALGLCRRWPTRLAPSPGGQRGAHRLQEPVSARQTFALQ